MSKEISNYDQVRNKILSGIEKLSAPIRTTLTPLGRNVIYESSLGTYNHTNDGVTIASQIKLKDPIENATAQIVCHAALRTNKGVGDGTTTSIILSQAFIEEGFRLIDHGWNPMALKRELDKARKELIKSIERQTIVVSSKKDIEFVARVSANNDTEVSKNVLEAVLFAGDNGTIITGFNSKDKTEVIKEEGFLIEEGMFSPLLSNQKDKFLAKYDDVKILITDKRIYYPNEALAILSPLAENGVTDVVIVARDFIGQAPNLFIANHQQEKMNILLVKDSSVTEKNSDSLEDLAAYLGCNVISEKKGERTFDVKLEDFGTAKKVISSEKKTLILSEKKSASATHRISALKRELDKDSDNQSIRKRLASMTSGTVSIFVGGGTIPEVREKLFRYDDSISAARAARDGGYVIGGGVSFYKAIKEANLSSVHPDVRKMVENACLAPLKQIAENCNIYFPLLVEKVKKGLGYNAYTGRYCNLERAGIIEPVLVPKLCVDNAISVAGIILSSQFIITINEQENDTKTKTERLSEENKQS